MCAPPHGREATQQRVLGRASDHDGVCVHLGFSLGAVLRRRVGLGNGHQDAAGLVAELSGAVRASGHAVRTPAQPRHAGDDKGRAADPCRELRGTGNQDNTAPEI